MNLQAETFFFFLNICLVTNRVKGYKNKSKFSCRLFLQLWVLLQLAKPLVHLLEELPFSKFVFIFLLVFNELQSWAKWNCQVQPFLTYKNGHFIWSNVTLWLEDLKRWGLSIPQKATDFFFLRKHPDWGIVHEYFPPEDGFVFLVI